MGDVVRLRITFLTAKNILGQFLAYVSLGCRENPDTILTFLRLMLV